MHDVWAWIKEYEVWLWWIGSLSIVLFILTLIGIVILINYLPTKYFVTKEEHRTQWSIDHPMAALLFRIIRNIFGVFLLCAGLVMLLTPGQGLLTILLGIIMIDFPGKFRFESWLVRKRNVHRTLNWIRRKGGKKPFKIPDTSMNA